MKTAGLASLAIVCAFCASTSAVAPADNPVAAMYGDTAYPWANQIKWNAVYNILDYGGVADGTTDNVAAFNAARDAANAAGGGVVYFPTGTYYFAGSIQLKNGVVIRGDTPTGVTSGKTDGYAPTSKLVFPQYVPTFTGSGTPNSTAFKTITTSDSSNDSNIGLVNVDVNRASISFSNGGGYSARNHNIVVFGVRNNNVAVPTSGVPNTYQNAWQRYCDPFATNIVVNPWKNALVANNRVNDNCTDSYFQPGYLVYTRSNTTAVRALMGTTYTAADGFAEFSYTDHYGVSVGRGGEGSANAATPLEAPAKFRTGISIADNYIYATMRVKLSVGGYGTQVTDNVLRDRDNKHIWVHPYGQIWQTNNAATYENRGIDINGYDVTVSGNDYKVTRHLICYGPYSSVDGEGILMQQWYGTKAVGERILNNTGNSYVGLWYMGEIRDLVIEGNTVTNDMVFVDASDNHPNYQKPMYNVIIRNNTAATSVRAAAGQYGAGDNGNQVYGNTATTIEYSTPNVSVHDNTGTLSAMRTATLVNRGPDVAVTSPTMWANAGSAVTLTAAASDVDGSVTQVEFYNHKTLIGTDADGSDGWSIPYAGVTYGSEYMVFARATDNGGATWVSDPVYFTAVLDGDANKDRYVDVIDLGVLATNYGKPMGCQWQEGDFNGDGTVDVIDLGLLATKYGQAAADIDPVAIPEPITLNLLGVGVVGFLRRK